MTTPWLGSADSELDYVADVGTSEQLEGYEAMMDLMAIYEHTRNRLINEKLSEEDDESVEGEDD
jgi:hypothetical protein